MKTEEIIYKTSRSGTTIFYFVPNIKEGDVPELTELTWVTLNRFGGPVKYGYFKDSNEIWNLQLTDSWYYVNKKISSANNLIITGYSKIETFSTKIEDYQKEKIKNRFISNIPEEFRTQAINTDPISIPDDTVSVQRNQTGLVNPGPIVLFKNGPIDDMYANIKLSRSFETLDTLKIYNKTINSIPSQEARTGVVYGKLEAKQLLKDENGNTIRVPLRNVPIGIFNPSDEFPTPSSLNEDGDRFFLNINENTKEELYFDQLAYFLDKGFLRSASEFKSTPEKFKYVTITNENGEFILYDVPVGNQMVVFEIDLFKQGLTHDEIVLNNFPFPTSEGVSLGLLPCYYYNQVPVDIVPSWGTNQSGYTELNVSVNLDLRKWTTYIFPPAAYGREKLEITTSKNIANTLKIQIRDMTVQGFPLKSLTVTQIDDDLDRNGFSRYSWSNEFTDQKNTLKYDKFGCHVLKLPANLYDPIGYRTDSNGMPTNQKGVWLSAYQFKVYVNENVTYRTTGGFLNPGNNFFYSHFNLNYTGDLTNSETNPSDGQGIGTSIYSKPWSISFPEKYKITKRPTQARYFGGEGRTFKNPYIIEEPWYSDGDYVGVLPIDPTTGSSANASGFALQNAVSYGNFVINRIGEVATKGGMYKYEKDVAWNETYSNGYEPYWTQEAKGPYTPANENDPKGALAGMSSVNNGEKYQRLECGYGYFMKYREWPRIFRIEWGGDFYYMPDITSSSGPQPGALDGNTDNPGPGITQATSYNGIGFSSYRTWFNKVYNLDNKNLAFAFNNISVKRNTIDIYRILKSGTDDISIPQNFVIATSTKIDFGHVNRAYALQILNNGTISVNMINRFARTIYVEGGGISGRIAVPKDAGFNFPVGGLINIHPETVGSESEVNATLDYTNVTFPGNHNFNIDTNKYETARYNFRLVVSGPVENDNQRFSGGEALTFTNYAPQLELAAKISPDTHAFYSRQYIDDKESKGINVDGQSKDNDDRIYRMILT